MGPCRGPEGEGLINDFFKKSCKMPYEEVHKSLRRGFKVRASEPMHIDDWGEASREVEVTKVIKVAS